jgi:enoyl-CoA hydratase
VEIRERDLAGIPFRAPTAMPVRQPFEVLMECYKPTIAALNGSAVAGGLELALACDIRIAAAGIFIGAPEAKVGMGANFASVVLPRRIPVGVAMEMLFTGDYITSEDALKWGLVNRVVEQERVMDESINLAERMLANSPISIRAMKERAMKGLEMPVPAALRLNVGPNPYLSDDRKEGIAARNEGRTPVWPNR